MRLPSIGLRGIRENQSNTSWKFRNIRNLDFVVPKGGNLFCLTGQNGCGKSTIFRLISIALGHLGSGASVTPFNRRDADSEFTITLDMNDEMDELWNVVPVESYITNWTSETLFKHWDKIVSITWRADQANVRSQLNTPSITSLGSNQINFEGQFLTWLSTSFDSMGSLKHLHLQADRAFEENPERYRGRMSVGDLELLSTIFGKKNSSFRDSRDLYAEWIGFLGHVEKSRLLEARQRGRLQGSDGLIGYEDPLRSLNALVQSVLPTISIRGVQAEEGKLVVGNQELDLSFQDLSGGEREVLFLCGQIDRLRLTRGILLIDEPELHLNSDLLRRFLTVIQRTAGEGQLWLATHSYEAIEAAGESNTFVMDSPIGKDTNLISLRDQPVVRTLTSVLGRAGFGLSNTLFVVVEGSKNSLREKQRFSELIGHSTHVRFVDIGEGKRDVLRLFDALTTLAKVADEQLAIKAVIDADFDSLGTAEQNDHRVHELGVHEVEKLFLEPVSLREAVANITPKDEPHDFVGMVRSQYDATAGRWIWDRVQYRHNAEWEKDGKRPLTRQCRGLISTLSWEDIDSQKTQLLCEISQVDESISRNVRSVIGDFSRLRMSPDLWKHCFGKETLLRISMQVGFNDQEKLERAVISTWDEGRASRPQELIDLRSFLGITD